MQINLTGRRLVVSILLGVVISALAAVGTLQVLSVFMLNLQAEKEEAVQEMNRVQKMLGKVKPGDILVFSQYDSVHGWTQEYGFVMYTDTAGLRVQQMGLSYSIYFKNSQLEKVHPRIIPTGKTDEYLDGLFRSAHLK